jgi:pimeloyl-ACP methyl ester carboxylesterase
MKRQHILITTIILISVFLSSCATISIPRYHSVEVTDAGISFYILNDKIDTEKPYPVIIFVAGSEVYSKVGYKKGLFSTSFAGSIALKHFGYYDFNYLTIALEKRNIPEGYFSTVAPEKFHKTNTLEQRVKDTETAINYILKHYNLDKHRVILVAGSEGGSVAAIVARNNTSITHLIIQSAGGWSHEDQIKYSIKHSTLDQRSKYLKELQSLDSFNRFLLELQSNPDSLDKWWYGWPYKRWASYMFYRPINDLRMLDIPILIQIGDKNDYAGLKGAIDVKKEFNKLEKSNLSLKIYNGLDHGFKDEKGVSHAKKIFEDFYQWLEEN